MSGPLLNLRDARRIWVGKTEANRLWVGGAEWVRPLTRAERVIETFSQLSGPWAYFLADDLRGGAGPWSWRRNPAAIASGVPATTLDPHLSPIVTPDDPRTGGLSSVGSDDLPTAGCWHGYRAGGFFTGDAPLSTWTLFSSGMSLSDVYFGQLAFSNSIEALGYTIGNVADDVDITVTVGHRFARFAPMPGAGIASAHIDLSSRLLSTTSVRLNNSARPVAEIRDRGFVTSGPLMMIGGFPKRTNETPADRLFDVSLTPLAVQAFCVGQSVPEADLDALEALRVSLS